MKVEPAGERDLGAFQRLPFRIYERDACWVPPLLSSERKLLDRRVHPFHRHSEVAYWLARDGGRVVGRIAAIVNREHLKVHDDGVGFWGFFECEPSPEAAGALFGEAEGWLRSKGMRAARGPMNFSVNETCGLLVEGFETPPYILMPHNPPWYAELVGGCGYAKAMDLLAFHLHRDDMASQDSGQRVMKRLDNLERVRFRPIDRSRLREEIKLVNGLFNDAWRENWGFVPMTEAELKWMADDLKRILDPRFTFVAQVDGAPIAFAIALPNVNPLLRKIRGRLFPFGWLKVLLGRKKIDSFRVCLMGVRRDHQGSGIGALFSFKILQDAIRAGARQGEMSWILETNRAMIAPLERMGASPYKRYRIYEKGFS